jgi:hypothetical protein
LWRRRLILALLLVCHRSYRGVHERLRDLCHGPRSLGSIHAVARAAMDQARAPNEPHGLSGVDIGAHDEIVPAGRPVPLGVDVASTYGSLLSPEEHRDGAPWGLRLLALPAPGFAPRALISDGGRGLVAGPARARPALPRRGDVFHVGQEVTPLVTVLQNRAYQALAPCAQRERHQAASQRPQGRRDGSVSQKLRPARPAADAAVALADDVATLVGWLRPDVRALAWPRPRRAGPAVRLRGGPTALRGCRKARTASGRSAPT